MYSGINRECKCVNTYECADVFRIRRVLMFMAKMSESCMRPLRGRSGMHHLISINMSSLRDFAYIFNKQQTMRREVFKHLLNTLFIAMDWKWFVIQGTQAAEQRHVNCNDVIMDESSVGATQFFAMLRGSPNMENKKGFLRRCH